MAGHSKWANIQHRKGKQDAKRGKLFTKLIREITVAARLGGGDADTNPRLRAAIDSALGNNMPKDTVERAVRRGSGEEGIDPVEEVRYEGYGPGGVAVMVDCMTDNRNRTVADVRHAFNKCGGNLGTDGSVAYLFSKIGVINFAAGVDEDRLMEAAMEAGAEDIVSNDDGSLEVLTRPDEWLDIKNRLVDAGLEPESAEVTMRAATDVRVERDDAEKILRLFDMLDDLDDTQNVYSNADLPDEVLAEQA
ncbi:YebC/PmpR family DNA-binding regulatory protein [Methylohalomonas lacus]|uniref:Probable transcriptional regulatory protein J2T55_002216 n=1 Tax=Methylohalomonas lacus TaxID=398773 RepID=A0AAE3L2A2_9GAMM|nr:YebC/PmpR family DNA-binding transcriptional regulator [Methylohalomonas lacus]MCS3904181.1 YebC/PmpR family DNA-binding regulatory protein [Methylohalomonas lacus]